MGVKSVCKERIQVLADGCVVVNCHLSDTCVVLV